MPSIWCPVSSDYLVQIHNMVECIRTLKTNLILKKNFPNKDNRSILTFREKLPLLLYMTTPSNVVAMPVAFYTVDQSLLLEVLHNRV